MDFIILAAGNGSRMHSATPKIFQEIAGKPCIAYIIEECRKFSEAARIIVVTKKEFANHEIFKDITIAIQNHPLGTADAVKSALPFLKSQSIIVMYADMPLIQIQDLSVLIKDMHKIALIAARIPQNMINMPYGRIIDGSRIVEYKDATDEQRKIDIINTGIYKFDHNFLQENIINIHNNNSSNEYYLTDILDLADANDKAIYIVDNYWAFHGVNTMQDLIRAEAFMQNKLRKQAIANGVKMLDPNSVYLSHNTVIAHDVVIEQNVVLKGNVEIQSGVFIKAFSYIENSIIMENAKVGPFARIRDGALLSSSSEIGNFVEVKNSIIGEMNKIKHLSYIGDATLGACVNVGAGTITCNYDGFKKHKTEIGNNVMVGANCSLVAPIKIGDGTVIAAGSTITENTGENTLAIARSRQENKNDGAIKFRRRSKC